jgi:hypothetical protein
VEKFQNLLREIDAIINRGSEDAEQYRMFTAQQFFGYKAREYKVPGLIIHMYEPKPDAVRELPTDLMFQVVIHNHPVGPCFTPRFCFELGFDPTILPLKVRKNFMAVNGSYFTAPKKNTDVQTSSLNLSL